MMSIIDINTDLLNRLKEATANKDITDLKEIKVEIGRDRWLRQFNGSVPPEAWLGPNPFIKFIE